MSNFILFFEGLLLSIFSSLKSVWCLNCGPLNHSALLISMFPYLSNYSYHYIADSEFLFLQKKKKKQNKKQHKRRKAHERNLFCASFFFFHASFFFLCVTVFYFIFASLIFSDYSLLSQKPKLCCSARFFKQCPFLLCHGSFHSKNQG